MKNDRASLLSGLFGRLGRAIQKDEQYRKDLIEALTNVLCWPPR
jgi:hypothetical protein